MTALNNVKVSGSCFYKFMKITAQTYTSISKQIPAGRLCQMAIQVVRYKKSPRGGLSMMEKAKSCEGHYHVMAVCCLDNIVIANRSAGLCNILNTALECSLDIVSEGEESV